MWWRLARRAVRGRFSVDKKVGPNCRPNLVYLLIEDLLLRRRCSLSHVVMVVMMMLTGTAMAAGRACRAAVFRLCTLSGGNVGRILRICRTLFCPDCGLR
jgi:hypothetical protein